MNSSCRWTSEFPNALPQFEIRPRQIDYSKPLLRFFEATRASSFLTSQVSVPGEAFVQAPTSGGKMVLELICFLLVRRLNRRGVVNAKVIRM